MTFRDFRDSKIIRGACLFALVVTLLINVLFAQLSLSQNELRLESPTAQASYLLPSANVLQAACLNHRGLAADVVWVSGLVYFGEEQRRDGSMKYLKTYAHTISELDPYFHTVYKWFADVYLSTRFAFDPNAIEVANRFLERGMLYFPNDHALPYTAAMNYIGYSRGASSERLLRESERAIDFLERAAVMKDAPDNVPMLLDYFNRRRRKLEAQVNGSAPLQVSYELTDEQRDLYVHLYLMADRPSVRQRILALLRYYDVDSDAILRLVTSHAERLEDARVRAFAYLPVSIWTTVIEPPKEHESRSSP